MNHTSCLRWGDRPRERAMKSWAISRAVAIAGLLVMTMMPATGIVTTAMARTANRQSTAASQVHLHIQGHKNHRRGHHA